MRLKLNCRLIKEYSDKLELIPTTSETSSGRVEFVCVLVTMVAKKMLRCVRDQISLPCNTCSKLLK